MGVLDGKVAIVTGSGQGIGRGIAIGLAREGCAVVTNNRKKGTVSAAAYDKNSMPAEDYAEMQALAGDAETTARLIKSEGGTAIPCFADVSKPEDAERLVRTAIDEFGHIDIIVNNAAGMGSGSIVDLDEAMWDKLTVTKLKGAFNLMHAAVPHMIEQGFGRIFNGSSDAWVGLADNDAYSAANAGMVGLTWAAAKELYRHDITVNAYCPQGESPAHAVEYNKMVRHVKEITGQDPDPKLLAVVEADHGDPANLGPFFAYLSTPEAGNVSGEVFAVKSSGRFERYQYPQVVARIARDPGTGPLWDVADLAEVFPQLLGEDYVSHAAKRQWA